MTLSDLWFGIGIHPLGSELESEVNLWYLDDGTLGRNPEVVIRDIETVLAA